MLLAAHLVFQGVSHADCIRDALLHSIAESIDRPVAREGLIRVGHEILPKPGATERLATVLRSSRRNFGIRFFIDDETTSKHKALLLVDKGNILISTQAWKELDLGHLVHEIGHVAKTIKRDEGQIIHWYKNTGESQITFRAVQDEYRFDELESRISEYAARRDVSTFQEAKAFAKDQLRLTSDAIRFLETDEFKFTIRTEAGDVESVEPLTKVVQLSARQYQLRLHRGYGEDRRMNYDKLDFTFRNIVTHLSTDEIRERMIDVLKARRQKVETLLKNRLGGL